jgi:hypothetical protein
MRGGVTTGSHRIMRAEDMTNTGDTSTEYGGQGPYQGTGAQGGGYGGGYPPPNNYQPRDSRSNWHNERHP